MVNHFFFISPTRKPRYHALAAWGAPVGLKAVKARLLFLVCCKADHSFVLSSPLSKPPSNMAPTNPPMKRKLSKNVSYNGAPSKR